VAARFWSCGEASTQCFLQGLSEASRWCSTSAVVTLVCLQRQRHVVDEILCAPSTLNVAPTSATRKVSGRVQRKFVPSWLSRDVCSH
jgi:hypothetical protein